MSRLLPESGIPRVTDRRRRFLESGYLVLGSVLEPATVAALAIEADRLASQMTGSAVDRRIACLDAVSELVFDVARLPDLVRLAEELVGKAVVPIRNDLRESTRPDGRARQHQNLYEEHFDDELAVTLWIPLPASGPVRIDYSDGGPSALLPHVACPEGLDALVEPTRLRFTPVVAAPGELLAHHACAVHRIGAPFRAYTFTYRGSSFRQAQRDRAGVGA
jgi:hypothetical protein